MKNIYFVSILFLVIFNTSCICDCFDEGKKAFYFEFSLDSLNNGFKKSEIDTIIVYQIEKRVVPQM
jgi:hypothetical protein